MRVGASAHGGNMRVWCFNRQNQIVACVEVADFNEARKIAREWNRSPGKLGRVEIIANARTITEATAVTAVY